ncbi:antitoxin ParD1/3/4 [Caulobacter ginsengisoli]|uniref:Antitoxin ParD1/3/4 n=1 Tax=Caulobacter ginsengisoli TaxID=400775 RepID=A0ABU0IPP9_9CAUL|nr:type II toxin-antitoxin system ParD family antitoxin [Caulobacter ginsengisoli]MDQ0463986.1 antitoxin ParD1/3/4 [Caulobacter ginsengisoli]
MTVTLGAMHEKVEARVKSGAYASASEVVRAGLRALDREEETLNAWMRAKIREALDDPAPSIPAEDVLAELRAHHLARMAADGEDL